MNRYFVLFAILTLFWSLAGCDKACKFTVNEQAKIRNYTGNQISLSVCRGFLQSKQQVTVPAEQTNVVSLGQTEDTKVQGGPASLSKCTVPEGETRDVSFALSAESFNKVSLCFSDSTKEYAIIPIGDACPAGTRIQSQAATCN